MEEFKLNFLRSKGQFYWLDPVKEDNQKKKKEKGTSFCAVDLAGQN